MTQNTSLERMVAQWMADETAGATPDHQVDQILNLTARQRPWPRWLAVLREPPMHAQSRVVVGSPTQRLMILGALVLLAATAVVGVGAALLLRTPPLQSNDCGKVPVLAGPVPSLPAGTDPSDPFTLVASYSAGELGLAQPLALAVGPTCDIFVTDLSNRVSQFAPNGTLIRRWGQTGTEPGSFRFGSAEADGNAQGSIAVGPDGKVYVSDSGNWRVQVFSADGASIRQFGTRGSGDGQFQIPYDLSVDVAGNVYVEDDRLMRLSKFAADGSFIWVVDGTTDPVLAGHGHSATIDDQGRIVEMVDDNGKVVYLDADGKVLDSFDGGDACNVTIDHAGHLFVTNCLYEDIKVFDASHTQIALSVGRGIGAPKFGPGDEVVALGADGSIQILAVNLPGS